MATKDYKELAKKSNSTILKARLRSGKFECPEEKEAYISVLKLRNVDVSEFLQSKESEDTAPIKVDSNKEEKPEISLNDAADEAYDSICEENNQTKVKLLADLLDRGDGTSKDWEEITDDEKKKIIEISEMKVEVVKEKTVKEKQPKTPSEKPVRAKKESTEELPEFTEEQKEVAEMDNLSKAERTRKLYDLGCTVKQIAKNTGWDYVNAYDTIKAYEKKKAKQLAEQSDSLV